MKGRNRYRRRLSLSLPRVSPRATGEGLLLAGLFFCPLALGTVPLWATLVMLGVASGAAFALVVSRSREAMALPLLGVGLFGLCLLVGAQALPLPPFLLRWLDPAAAAVYSLSLQGLAQASAFHPASLDGPATGRELAKAFAYALTFLAAVLLSGSRRAHGRLARALALSGLLVAAIGYAHRLLGLGQLFGRPFYGSAFPRLVTTFGNSNNAAGLFVLCAPVSLGLALRSRQSNQRLLWGLAFLLTGAAIFLTLSRGGVVAFVIGQLLFGSLLWTRRARSSTAIGSAIAPLHRRARLALPLLAIAAALAVGSYLAFRPVADRFASLSSPDAITHSGKVTGFRQAAALIPEFPLLGIGRGAFPTAGARVLSEPNTAEYVENEPIQLAVDLGVPVAAAFLALLVLALLRAFRLSARGPVETGLWIGVLSLGLQNLGDFSLELGGVAFPATVAFGLLLGAPTTPETPLPSVKSLRLPSRWILASLMLGVPLACWALANSAPDWRQETDAFARAAPSLSGAQAAQAAGPVLARHPASFVVPLAVADRYQRERNPVAALSWVNRALYFKPTLAAGHLISAVSLAELGHQDQALLEARLYSSLSGGDLQAIAALVRFYPAPEDLRRAVGDDGAGLERLAGFLLQHQRPVDAVRAATWGVEQSPADAEVHRRAAAIFSSAGQRADAEREDLEAIRLAPGEPQGYLGLSANRSAAGDAEGAIAALQLGLTAHPGDDDLVLALVRLQLSRGQAQRAEDTLQLLGPQSASPRRAEVFALQGQIASQEGRLVKAEEAYRNAIRISPGAGETWALVALLETELKFAAAEEVLQEFRVNAGPEQQAAIAQRLAQEQQRRLSFQHQVEERSILRPPPTQ